MALKFLDGRDGDVNEDVIAKYPSWSSFTNDDVTLTLTGPSTLHVEHHETFVDPADPRGPIDLVADLTRQPT